MTGPDGEAGHDVTQHNVTQRNVTRRVDPAGSVLVPEVADLPTNLERAQTLRRARVRRWYVMQIPFFLVLGGMTIAGILVLVDRWRRGAFLFGGSLAFGAVLRALLPASRAGLLQVRGRAFDVAALTTLATVVLWMAITIDPLGTR